MTQILSRQQQAQILTPPVLRLMSIIAAAGGEARIVGGAARDVIMSRPVGDIDMAVNLPPEQVIEILAAEKIKTVPTGLAHGTITAVIDRTGYEITTLRRDVTTDGRHAQIAFTDNWREDAARRDFTFNALYVDHQGRLYDYFNGRDDAALGYVRFIGHASKRIDEDVLRILRFFRFTAWFSQTHPDAEALAACEAAVDRIPQLSKERVAHEILKLLAAPNPVPAWQLLRSTGVLSYVAAQAVDFHRLQNFLNVEEKFGEPVSAITRLAALLPADATVAANIATHLKFSNRDSAQLITLARLPPLLQPLTTPQEWRRIIYTHGSENTRTALLLNGIPSDAQLSTLAAWENPVFPIKGEDILKQGVPSGQRVGEILRQTEEWWISGDLRASKSACLAQAELYGKNP